MSATGHQFMSEPEAITLLSSYKIGYPAHAIAKTADEAAKAAATIGFPVVIKVISPQISHKSDVGGVVVNLKDEAAVKEGFERMAANVKKAQPQARIDGALVCAMAPSGVEAIIGGIIDSNLGPAVMFGLGGIFAEVLRDVAFRCVPLTRLDAEEMLQEIKGYPLLKGARGQDPVDMDALIDLILSVGKLMEEHPEITELDLNPVRLYKDSALALDARILVAGK